MTRKERFLDLYDREHATTMRVLRAYPKDKLDLRPHPKLKTARELAAVFILERYLAGRVYNDEIAKGIAGKPPQMLQNWDEMLSALEKAHLEGRNLVASASDEDLEKKVHFFVAPKTMGEYSRIEFLEFLLRDQIHHRGQFSVYLRMAEGKVPSIYGATADEPWV
jgi:uncharacterized damage-inducible protein DinB